MAEIIVDVARREIDELRATSSFAQRCPKSTGRKLALKQSHLGCRTLARPLLACQGPIHPQEVGSRELVETIKQSVGRDRFGTQPTFHPKFEVEKAVKATKKLDKLLAKPKGSTQQHQGRWRTLQHDHNAQT